ncbi:MAG TPA: glycosyl transferase family 1 [Cyanobacteria bacterium UBA11149]|nr:glycosyl transferase family 1 [Cyanobacteria bacterium UBA11367]HBE59966.1 glycosyl transferase family 1 [Cyanobacteria bacterium UBA11366]HBK63996.1 glycosyl transferase family 1 [Cyanobacteria bacterium UBA11166]HBR74381.1 glycosyl transferase family 1 [Cyanobacteria bacterium UBA11159]HBS68341.1 glycosyl transferase family 1 [Cyanobacteria bacterium UBA11153]HBW87381.1 glycosyl transferase family 1 [Cyanobacteria bacterium UBA11149]HCA97233.1 glycosyl transferase family 1 [Cyanobacteria
MDKHYILFSRNISLKPGNAHEIHDVICANAAANLGYSSVLVYPDPDNTAWNPVKLLSPFTPRQPDSKFQKFYNSQEKLKVAPLPKPWPIDRFKGKISGKLSNFNTILSKYYFPFHILHHTKIVHTRDWNFVKTVIKHKVPVIYERHYYQEKPFEPEIVSSPFFQIAVTQSEIIRQSLIQYGMPPEKVVWLDNGFEQLFLMRQPQEAEAWRKELLTDGQKQLVIYSGSLHGFKGIHILIDAAKELPEIQFALTGGTESQLQEYQEIIRTNNIHNVTFLGWILPKDRLISLLQAADVLVHPHCSGNAADFTNPVKFFQYMASGTPMVATEIGPLMRFKSSPIVAAWCPPDNPTELAQSIEYTLNTYPRKIEGYGESIKFARQFSWENRTEKILSYVQESMRPKQSTN